MTTKKSELLYWDGTYWNNAAHRYWDGDSWENDRDDGSPQTTYPTNENPLINLVITDIIGNPKSAKFVIANPSREVYSSTAAKQAGRFTGVFTDFQNIRIRDGSNGTILFAGKIYDVKKKFDFQYGSTIEINAKDSLEELRTSRSSSWKSYTHILGNTTKRSDVIADLIGGNTTQQEQDITYEGTTTQSKKEDYLNSKSITTDNFDEDTYTAASTNEQTGETAGTASQKIQDSVVTFTDDTSDLVFKGNKSGLSEIAAQAQIEPHGTAVTEKTYGYDFYVDPGVVKHDDAIKAPKQPWSYFKRGTRPHATPATYGLTVELPLGATTVTPTGFKQNMYTDFVFEEPKEELYTDIILDYSDAGKKLVSASGAASQTTTSSGKQSTPKRRRFERIDITAFGGGQSGKFDGLDPSADATLLGRPFGQTEIVGFSPDSPAQTTINNDDGVSSGVAYNDSTSTLTVVSSAGMIAGDHIHIGTAANGVDTSVNGEIVKITNVASSTSIAVTRGTKWGAAAKNIPNDAKLDIINPFGRAEYQSATSGSGLSGAFMIVSPLEDDTTGEALRFTETTDHYFPEEAGVIYGMGNTPGDRSLPGPAATTGASPRFTANAGTRKTKTTRTSNTTSPFEIRRNLVAYLSRNTSKFTRGNFRISNFPYTYIEAPSAKLTSTATACISFQSAAFTAADGSTTTNNPQTFGVTAGDVICNMDATSTDKVTRYSYISNTTTSQVTMGAGAPGTGTALTLAGNPATSDGSNMSTSAAIRIFMPVRAGHVIHVKNAIESIDAIHLVNKLEYTEGLGTSYTVFDTVDVEGSVTSTKPNVYSNLAEESSDSGEPPTPETPNFTTHKSDWLLNGVFKSYDATVVRWGRDANADGSAPDETMTLSSMDGAYTYSIVAGDTGTLSAERVVYFDPTADTDPTKAGTFRMENAATFEVSNSSFLKIADVKNVANSHAQWELADGITLGASEPKFKSGGKIDNQTGGLAGLLFAVGAAGTPSVKFDVGSRNSGLYHYTSGTPKEYIAVTANGVLNTLFGESGAANYMYEHLWSEGVAPRTDDTYDLGTSSYKWDDIYATNDTIQTSDARLKENIQPVPLGLDFINDLNPVTYKWKKKKEDKSNYTHYGIIAQEVVEILKKHGIDSLEDFAGITHDGEADTHYGARYSEFIPILIKAVQELSEEVNKLKEKK